MSGLDLGHQLFVHIDGAFDDGGKIGHVDQKRAKICLSRILFVINIGQIGIQRQGIVGNTHRHDDPEHICRTAAHHADQRLRCLGKEFKEKQHTDGTDKADGQPAFLFLCFFHFPGDQKVGHTDNEQGQCSFGARVGQDKHEIRR